MWPHPLIGNFVYLYGVMIAVGLLGAFAVVYLYGKRMHLTTRFTDFIFYNAVASIICGFGSAALFQAVYDFIENPENGFHLTGSITFIGGLIGGAVCFLLIWLILRKRVDGRLTDLLTLAPCAITLAHGFGRIGCFFSGCCYGVPTDSFLGIQFPDMSTPVHPTQLYEAVFLFMLFGVLTYLLLGRGFRHNMSVYLIAYGVFRFLIEYLRGDHRGELVNGFSPSQFWSLLMIALGVGLIFIVRYLEKRTPQKADKANRENT